MSARPPLNLMRELAARRGADQTRAYRRIEWQLRLTSLWTPLAIFGLLFVPYVLLTQLAPGAASWAQPLIKACGLLMVVATLALGLWGLANRRLSDLRRARVESQEMLFQMARELRNAGEAARQVMLAGAQRVDERWLEGDAAELDKATDSLAVQADTQLPGWKRRGTWDAARGLVLTLIGVVLLRTLVVEPFRIPSGSMLPTLEIGDHVVVNRFIYGVRIPWLNKVPFVIVRPPRRGDVIVFENPLDPTRDFIKRVIGLPGDHIEIVHEVVHINGEPQPQQLLQRDFTVYELGPSNQWYPVRNNLLEEELSGWKHLIALEPNDNRSRSFQGTWTVPEGNVFVMGDNRDNSADSRYGFAVPGYGLTFVPYGNIKGKAMLVWLSLGHDGLGSRFFGGSGLRLDRFFLPVR